MQFQRCQHDGLPDEGDVCNGEAGRGLYAFVPSPVLRRYYTGAGEQAYTLTLLQGRVVDLTREAKAQFLQFARAETEKVAAEVPGFQKPRITASNLQRYGRLLEQFIAECYADAVAYIVPHKGPGIPTGKQVVIRQLSAFAVSARTAKP